MQGHSTSRAPEGEELKATVPYHHHTTHLTSPTHLTFFTSAHTLHTTLLCFSADTSDSIPHSHIFSHLLYHHIPSTRYFSPFVTSTKYLMKFRAWEGLARCLRPIATESLGNHPGVFWWLEQWKWTSTDVKLPLRSIVNDFNSLVEMLMLLSTYISRTVTLHPSLSHTPFL